MANLRDFTNVADIKDSDTKLRPLSNHEIAVFCTQMSMLIKGGVSPYECVSILLSDTKDKEGQALLTRMMLTINTGERLYTAIEQTGAFPDYVVNMIRLGEESGQLDIVLDALSDFYTREDELRETIRSALTYPLIMISVMAVVIFVLLSRVMPIFADVFAQLGTSMNAFSESLVSLGQNINRYSLVIIVVFILLILLALFFKYVPVGKKAFSAFAQSFGPTKRLRRDIAAGRFAAGMALALNSGMDTYNGIDMVDELLENKEISEKAEEIKRLIREDGMTFPEALSTVGIFNALYTRMILVGFKAGSIDASFKQIALHYRQDTDRRIYKIISVIEPTLVIILSIVVGAILLSVILPLMGIMSSIG